MKKDIKSVMSRIREEEEKLKKEKAEKKQAKETAESKENSEKTDTEDTDTENIDTAEEAASVGKTDTEEFEIEENTEKAENNNGSVKKNKTDKNFKEDKNSSDVGDDGTGDDADDADDTDETADDDLHIIEKLKKLNLNPLIKIVAVLLIVAGIAVIIAFNTPSRRYERNFLKAEKLYSEGKFEDALSKYEKALSIREYSVESYLGILFSKEALDSEDIEATYSSALDSFLAFPEETRLASKASIIEYVLHEKTIFPESNGERIEALEEGYEITDGAPDIERILKECVEEEIETKRTSGEFDEAIEIVEHFKDKEFLEAEKLSSDLLKEKEIFELKETVLSKAIDALKDYYDCALSGNCASPFDTDFSEILSLDGSDEADSLVRTYYDKSYIYIPNAEAQSEKDFGAGLYTFGKLYEKEGGSVYPYLFYVGEYKDGQRNGFGISFMKTNELSYVMYVGQWQNDVAEGHGTRYKLVAYPEGNKGYYRVYEGDWKNGLADGVINVTATSAEYPDTVFTGSFNATAGMGEEIPTESDEYVVLNIRSERLIAVLKSDTSDYALSLALWQKESTAIDALGIIN